MNALPANVSHMCSLFKDFAAGRMSQLMQLILFSLFYLAPVIPSSALFLPLGLLPLSSLRLCVLSISVQSAAQMEFCLCVVVVNEFPLTLPQLFRSFLIRPGRLYFCGTGWSERLSPIALNHASLQFISLFLNRMQQHWDTLTRDPLGSLSAFSGNRCHLGSPLLWQERSLTTSASL